MNHDSPPPELLLRTLIEKTDSIVYSYRLYPEPKLDYVSLEVERLTGYSQKEFHDDKLLLLAITHPEDRQELLDLPRSIVESPGKMMVGRLWRKDNALVWIAHRNMPVFDSRNKLIGLQGYARDITSQKQLEYRNHLLKEVALMVMEDNPLSAILTYICDKIVDIYGLNMAWIGMKEPDGRVSIGAAAGTPSPLSALYQLTVRWDDKSHGAAGKVIRSGKTFIVDLQRDIFQPWYDRLVTRKIRSIAAFPLKTKGNTLGALILYSTYEAFFSKRVINEIEDFGEQIALAINDAITKQQLKLITTGLHSAASAVVITDRNFLIHWFNPAFLRLTHLEKQEVRDQYFNSVIAGSDLDAIFYTNLRESILAGSTWQKEVEVPKKNLGLVPVEMIVTPVKNEKDETSHFIIVLHDLTQRKQAEAALQRYQLMYEQAQDSILIAQPDGRIIEANPAATRLYGYSQEEFLTMRLTSTFEPIAGASCLPDAVHQDIISNSNSALFETQHRRKDGEVFPVEVSSVRSIIGKEQIIFSIIRDITDRKQAELHKLQVKETIAQAEKLASLGRMAASISHEINQPLNSIKIITDSIQYWRRKGIDTETPDLLNAISNISSQADQIDKVIKHVRAFLHGKNAALLAPCSLNSIIESALSFLEAQLLSSEIHLRKDLANDLPPVLATPIGLEEIVINLVINAFYALKTTGQKDKYIVIATTFDDSIVMEVSDNGPGIADSIKDQIFEPFFSTTESEGMGLGLAIVKSIVTSYDGRINAVNNEQGGATFRVELPIWRPHIEEEML